MPLRTGTRANCPRGQRRSDRLGEHRAVDDAGDLDAEVADQVADRHAAQALPRSGPGSRPGVANVSPAASAVASGRWFSANVPLCTIARWNSPRAPGETSWASTDRPPADWPAMVTLCGSPPNSRDVALDPAQRRLLVHQAVVAGRAARPGGERRVREEAERAEPVVDRDDDDAVRRELGAVVVAGAVQGEASAVDPHEHRPATFAARAVGVYTFRYRQSSLIGPGGRNGFASCLRAARPELRGVADALPRGRRGGGRHRRLPVGGAA